MSDEGDLEKRFPGYRFGVVLLLLLATFIVMASGSSGRWSRVSVVLLQAATLVAALMAARVGRRTLRVVWIIVVVALVGAVASVASTSSATRGAEFVLNALLVGIAPVIIIRSLWRRGEVDIQTVLGAICVYVLVGMLWAFVFQAMATIGHTPFFAQQTGASTADTLYFSYVTLTTVGYGDLTAATSLGRSFAVLEALLGQIYLVTVVSILVSRLGRARRHAVETDPPT